MNCFLEFLYVVNMINFPRIASRNDLLNLFFFFLSFNLKLIYHSNLYILDFSMVIDLTISSSLKIKYKKKLKKILALSASVVFIN